MSIGQWILFAAVALFALGSFSISGFQFAEKGFLFNNAYLYASKQERETMDKRPHYRQSAIAFLLVGIGFLLIALEVLLNLAWLSAAAMLTVLVAIVYAIVSSARVANKGGKRGG